MNECIFPLSERLLPVVARVCKFLYFFAVVVAFRCNFFGFSFSGECHYDVVCFNNVVRVCIHIFTFHTLNIMVYQSSSVFLHNKKVDLDKKLMNIKEFKNCVVIPVSFLRVTHFYLFQSLYRLKERASIILWNIYYLFRLTVYVWILGKQSTIYIFLPHIT